MDYKFNIKKYVKFSLAANIILNNSIFARCYKKGDKGNKNNGCSLKKNKSTETNTNPNKKTPNNPKKKQRL